MHVVPSSPTPGELFQNFQNFSSNNNNFNFDRNIRPNNNNNFGFNKSFRPNNNFLYPPEQTRLRSPFQVVPSPSRVVSPNFDFSPNFDIRSPTMFSPTGTDKLSMSPIGFSTDFGQTNRFSSLTSTDFGHRNVDSCRQNRLSSVDSGRTTEGSSVSPSRSSFFDSFQEFRSEQVTCKTFG